MTRTIRRRSERPASATVANPKCGEDVDTDAALAVETLAMNETGSK